MVELAAFGSDSSSGLSVVGVAALRQPDRSPIVLERLLVKVELAEQTRAEEAPITAQVATASTTLAIKVMTKAELTAA